MKAVKIIIVVAVLAALGFGIWKIVTGIVPEGPALDGVDIPEECQGVANRVKKKCDRTYGLLSDGEFDGLQECYNKVYNYFAKDRSTEGCMTSVELALNTIHRKRFVDMSDKEQSNKEWPHREKMEALCDSSMRTAGNSDSDLNRIKRGCTEYDSLVTYNSKVNQQCKSKPSGLKSQWEMSNARYLVSNRPKAHEPANHTKPYEESEKSKVQEKLFTAHVEYLKAFVRKAEYNVKQSPIKKKWDDWSSAVHRELKTFENNAQQVYGKAPSEKAKEVKLALFAAHVEYLKALANTEENVTKNPSKKKWEEWLDVVRGELTTFENDAKDIYGKSPSDVSAKAKEVKNILCDSHESYLGSRIKSDSLIIIETPRSYDNLSDVLYAEIESFENNSWDYYGQSVGNKAEKLKNRVRALKPKDPEQPTLEP